MSWVSNAPTVALVNLVIELESFQSNETITDILCSRNTGAVRARWRAWAEVIRLSGCSMNGLALTWGCERAAIRRALLKMDAAA